MNLDEHEAYEAMRQFLQNYWNEFKEASLADVLGDINTELRADRTPADPAMWSDWLRAINTILDD